MKKMLILLLAMLCLASVALAETASPVLTLAGNPTTGYAWQAAVDREDVLSVALEYRAEETGMIGGGGQYAVWFTGLMPGEAAITLTYARPWEENPPLYTLIYHVQVDEDLNVTILSSSFDW